MSQPKEHLELYFFQCTVMQEYYPTWIKSRAADLCAIAGVQYSGVKHYDRKKKIIRKKWFSREVEEYDYINGHLYYIMVPKDTPEAACERLRLVCAGWREGWSKG